MAGGETGGAVYQSDSPDKLGRATNAVRAFQSTGANSGTWFSVAGMRQRRAYLTVAVWRSNIFAIGGEDDTQKYAAA